MIIIGGNVPIISSTQKQFNNSSNLNIDYLKNIPSNDYILGPGDKLNIKISRNYPELTTSAVVDGEGTIYLPKLNRIYIEGLTINELNNVLNEAINKFVRFPEVEVVVSEYRPIRVLVKGEVQNPGLQTMQGSIAVDYPKVDLEQEKTDVFRFEQNFIDSTLPSTSYFFPTVFDAIRQSGGITEFTDLSNIQIIRNNKLSDGGGKISTSINFEEVLISGDNSQNIRIYDSDIVVLGKTKSPNNLNLKKASLSNLNPKFIDVFITGRVALSGKTTVPKLSVLSDAVLRAGGPKIVKGPLTFIRFNVDGAVEKRKFRYDVNAKRGSYKNPYLKDGDLVYIGESLFSATSQIINEFASPFFSSYAILKLIN